MAVPLPEKTIIQIRELLRQNMRHREIAKITGVSVGSVSAVRRMKLDPKENDEIPHDVNVPLDTRSPDRDEGETSIITPDKPKSLDDIARMFKIDQNEWEAVTVRVNEWQGFFKARKEWTKPTKENGFKGSSTSSHQKVALWQTRVTWRRKVSGGIQKAITALVKQWPAFESRTRKPIVRPSGGTGQVASFGLWDAHLGMYAWQEETGNSFDLNKAVNRVCNAVDDVIAELKLYPLEKIWMPVGNDFLHFDNYKMQTTMSDHRLDADSRYAKVYAAGLLCLAYMVERAAEICPVVEGIYIPGNHDRIASYTLCMALAQRYRGDKRISIDCSANPRKYRTFGGTLIGFDHGQLASAQQLATIFSNECKKEWSSSTYHEIQVGHTHQRREKMFESLTPVNGVLVRTNPSLCNTDAYHHEHGWIGEPQKSVEAWRYSRDGYVGSHAAYARDVQHPAAKRPLT